MTSVTDWIRLNSDKAKPWLILGKGPSFGRRGELILSDYNTLSLNHVALLQPGTLNHFTDLDAYLACASRLLEFNAIAVLPWFPHLDNKPGKRSLAELCEQIPSLCILQGRNRLLTYNSTLAKKKKESLPVIKVRLFSAVAALNILVSAGVRTVFSLGIDGGSSYASDFDKATLLLNGRSSFDAQFAEMAKTIKKHKIKYSPLYAARRHGNDQNSGGHRTEDYHRLPGVGVQYSKEDEEQG